jgi:protein-histidine pros-kinase
VFNIVREKHPSFTYKEAVLNPTNTRNKAVGWEADLVKRFIDNPGLTEQEGEIIRDSKKLFYFAFPIAIKNPKCLACHSIPAAAPASMLALYGKQNGFDWKQNEIVGAQVVTVPLSLSLELAQRSFYNFVISMFSIFLTLFIALNLLMNRLIIKPIGLMTQKADVISHGNLKVKPMAVSGKDEIASLASSFNRMTRSSAVMARMIRKHQEGS